jgi:hypothetical protein
MKTGMEGPLLGIVAVAIAIVLWQAWSGMQVDLSVAALNATIAGQTTPEPLAAAWKGLLTFLGAGIFLLVVVTGGYFGINWIKRYQAREKAVARQGWKNGPNAYWERQPRPVSEAELMRAAILRSLAGQGQPPPRIQISRQGGGSDDEPQIDF